MSVASKFYVFEAAFYVISALEEAGRKQVPDLVSYFLTTLATVIPLNLGGLTHLYHTLRLYLLRHVEDSPGKEDRDQEGESNKELEQFAKDGAEGVALTLGSNPMKKYQCKECVKSLDRGEDECTKESMRMWILNFNEC
ncbi:hypothetical protein ACLOJK_031025 [Asimina triloba]